MAKYRKRPVVIEAVRVTAADFNAALEPPKQFDSPPFSEMPQWLVEAIAAGIIAVDYEHTKRECTDYAFFTIKTLEGDHRCGPGDFIIQGVKGEIYPCKSDIFAATYEPVEESQ